MSNLKIQGLGRSLVLISICLTPRAFPQEVPKELSPTDSPRAVSDPYFKAIDYGRSQVKDVPEQAFVAVAYSDLPKSVRGFMHGWLGVLLVPEADPHEKNSLVPGRMNVRAFAADKPSQDDLIEYRWNHLNQPFRALASRNAIRFEFGLASIEMDPDLRRLGMSDRERLEAWVQGTLRLQGEDLQGNRYHVAIPWSEALLEGKSFSTQSEQNLNRLTHWHRRVDGFTFNHTLFVLIYTKPAQLMHFQDGSKWFPDDFRALVHQKAREQGKLPPEVREWGHSSPNQPPP